MSNSTGRRKVAFFVIFTAAILLVIFLIPFVEAFVREQVATRFGLVITADGKVLSASENAGSGLVSATAFELIINIFRLLKVFLLMALVIAIVRLIAFAIFSTALRGAEKLEIASLAKTVFSVVIYIVSFFIIFQSQYPNVQLAPLFTGSTIIGIVVGLALQDTLGNLFAGIALQADQPFQVGDVISISNRGTGVVESVSWRGVRVRTFQQKLMVISNSVLGKETIEVAPRDGLNARLVFFNTLYRISPARTTNAVQEAIRNVENVARKPVPIVRIRGLGESGIDWEVKYWCEDYRRYNETDALVRERIWYAFNREGIDFAFPTRTLRIESGHVAGSEDQIVMATATMIGRVPIFEPLSSDELAQIAQESEHRVFARGETIVRQGSDGDSMFIILRGSVRVQVPGEKKTKTIGRLRSNDFFGEMGLLTGEPRSATVAAEDETEVLEIKKETLASLFVTNPGLMEAIAAIAELRRPTLEVGPDTIGFEKAAKEGTVLNSLRRFFGLKH